MTSSVLHSCGCHIGARRRMAWGRHTCASTGPYRRQVAASCKSCCTWTLRLSWAPRPSRPSGASRTTWATRHASLHLVCLLLVRLVFFLLYELANSLSGCLCSSLLNGDTVLTHFGAFSISVRHLCMCVHV